MDWFEEFDDFLADINGSWLDDIWKSSYYTVKSFIYIALSKRRSLEIYKSSNYSFVFEMYIFYWISMHPQRNRG